MNERLGSPDPLTSVLDDDVWWLFRGDAVRETREERPFAADEVQAIVEVVRGMLQEEVARRT